ncbi:hypothetical protein [Streptomyces sp. NPDC048057]|uniref:hypothetical protein n=1 Tax=Streptomyces sp. NPDC048057 TaxID=3155628 RepID=UPI0033C268DE
MESRPRGGGLEDGGDGSGSRAPEDDGGPPDGGDVLAEDRRWMPDLWAACFCALALLLLLHLVDLGAGTLSAPRCALWCTLGATLFVVLYPPRVTAGRDWLAVRGLVRERRIDTHRLVQVERRGGIAQRVVLRDVRGHRVEIDPSTLADNPLIWYAVEVGVARSRASGLLRTGGPVFDALARRMEQLETDAARAVFEASGLR